MKRWMMGRSDHTFTPSNRHYRFGNDRDVFGAYRCSVCPKQKQKFRLFCHVSAWMFVKSRKLKSLPNISQGRVTLQSSFLCPQSRLNRENDGVVRKFLILDCSLLLFYCLFFLSRATSLAVCSSHFFTKTSSENRFALSRARSRISKTSFGFRDSALSNAAAYSSAVVAWKPRF